MPAEVFLVDSLSGTVTLKVINHSPQGLSSQKNLGGLKILSYLFVL